MCDSAFTLLGESQEDDRKLIAELIIEKMNQNSKSHVETVKSSG